MPKTKKESVLTEEQLDVQIQRLQEEKKWINTDTTEITNTLLSQLQAAASTAAIIKKYNKNLTWRTDDKFKDACKTLGIAITGSRGNRKDPFDYDGNGHKFLVLIKDGKPHKLANVHKDLLMKMPTNLTRKSTLVYKIKEKKYATFNDTSNEVTITKDGLAVANKKEPAKT